MSPLRIPRPSPATAIALVALFVSLGGTTYAVTALPRNSVGTEQIRNRSVTESDLAGGSVITSKLADQAVTRRKLGLGAVTADRVAADALTGGQIDESTLSAVPLARDAERAGVAQRAALADRADRAAVADALGRVSVETRPITIQAGDFEASVAVPCAQGLVPVGGGYVDDDLNLLLVSESGPTPTGWRVVVVDGFNVGGGTGNAYAICVAAARP